MIAHEEETPLLLHIIRHDDGEEGRRLEESIAQVQRDDRCVQRTASVTALFALLAIVGVACETVEPDIFPFAGSQLVLRVLCVLGLASLICLVVFAGLLMRFRMKLNRLRKEGRRLAARVLERCLGQPGLAASPARQSRSDAPEMVAGATNAGGAP